MKEIKITDLTQGQFDVAKNWDILPIPRKIEIAKAAGVFGRVGSSTWEDLHEVDRTALLKLYAPEEQGTRPLVNPHASAVKQDDQLRAQQRHDKKYEVRGISGKVPKAVTELVEANLPTVQEPKPQDYLLWVGWGSYPTIKSFVDEANEMGVSRRISKIPKDLVLGKSRIFLAHDEGETGDAVIFGYFIPTAIEQIIFDETTNNIQDGVIAVTVEQAGAEQDRGCGIRSDVGSLYLISGDMETLKPPKDYNRIISEEAHRFRGIKKVDGQKILKGKAKTTPSLRYKVDEDQKMARKKGDPWTQDEIDLLRKLTSEMRPRRAFREMMKITGRSLPTMEWHYRKIRESEKDS